MALSRSVTTLSLLACAVFGAVPAPIEHFGFNPGDDYKLADFADISGYFRKLAASSDRIRLIEFGKSAEGRPMLLAFISAPENLKKLDRYREISRRLALGQATAEEARALAAEGKAIVWIDSGLHATETAPVQQAPHLAHKMLTDESEEVRRIRQNVILLQVPVINPDGLDMVAHWYRQNVGTAYEIAPLPKLYQKYSGHDNNRDWFMLNLVETRAVSKQLFGEWFPQIVYNQHQMGPLGARFTVPPYDDPLNPNIPAPVMEGINLIGTAIRERLSEQGKTGVLSYAGYDAWWNGGLRSTPAFHNMHGILTEAAHYAYATPRVFKLSELPDRLRNGMPAKEPSIFQQRPWMGGKWGLADSISYMMGADFAILDLAAARSQHFLLKAWEMARANIETGQKGKPYAYVLSTEQHDASAPAELLKRLMASGVVVRRAQSPFTVGGKSYAAGTLMIPAGQPFRGYVMDLLEPQKYPEIRLGSGATKRPYDLAGWTLSYQMGVNFDRIDEPFEASAEPVTDLGPDKKDVLDHKQNASFVTMAERLARGETISWNADGTMVAGGQTGAGGWRIRAPRVALYEPWTANMDTGWTQWMLDAYRIPHYLLHNAEVAGGGLRDKFDVVILASQPMVSILHGFREGEAQGARGGFQESPDPKSLQRPEYTGGLTLEGALELKKFVEGGGTLITFDQATELPLQMLPLGVRGLLGGGESSGGWYCPGSVLRADVDNTHPMALGMPAATYITSTGGQAFDLTKLPEFSQAKSVVNYAKKDLLASGWVSGERAVLGKAAMVDAPLGKGHVVLFGFRPQFRGQTFGTFKLVLNAIYLASATKQ